MSQPFNELEQKILNLIQEDFPLCSDPYGVLAGQAGCTRDEALQAVRKLRSSGVVRRIGGSFAGNKIGHISTLVACRVSPERIEAAAARASSWPDVTHNYERDGTYNLWFTVISPSQERVDEILSNVAACDGVEAVHSLPAGRTFKIRVKFDVAEGGDRA